MHRGIGNYHNNIKLESGAKIHKINIETQQISIKKCPYFLVVNDKIKIEVEKRPNFLHRFMQRLFFGFKYKKNNT